MHLSVRDVCDPLCVLHNRFSNDQNYVARVVHCRTVPLRASKGSCTESLSCDCKISPRSITGPHLQLFVQRNLKVPESLQLV